MSQITILIILITAFASIYGFYNANFFWKLSLNPYSIKERNQWYRFISSGFLHGDWMHLLVNMLVLYSFGSNVEYYYHAVFGNAASGLFILLYLSSIVASAMQSFYRHQNDPSYNSIGASGATSAIMFVSILFNPYATIYVYFIPIPGILAGILFLFYSSYMDKKGGDLINHNAHYWGAVYGIVFTLVFKPSLFMYFIGTLLHLR